MATPIVVEPTGVELDRPASMFAAVADPARQRILAVLADASRCVCDIRSAAPIAANLLSYHLRVLRDAGLIEGRCRGRWIDYHLAPGAARGIASALGAAGFAAVVDLPTGCAPGCEVGAR